MTTFNNTALDRPKIDISKRVTNRIWKFLDNRMFRRKVNELHDSAKIQYSSCNMNTHNQH